ncbi:MAG: TolC family protein [Magnetococcales bacterium]|nr:TolC family protein [Magnetococcales bacterium]
MKRVSNGLLGLLLVVGVGSSTACEPPPSPPSQPLSLTQVIDRALCNDAGSREAWASVRGQSELVGVAMAPFLPTIAAQAGWSRYDGTASRTALTRPYPYQQNSVGLSITYLLYDFGNRQATLDQAQQLLEALQFSHLATVQQLLYAAVQNYYQVLSRQALIVSTQEAEQVSQRAVQAAQLRHQVGSGVLADLLQARAAQAQAQLNRIRAEGDWQQSRGQLATLMGLPVTIPFELVVPNDQADDPLRSAEALAGAVEELIEQARRQRPDLAAAEANYRAAQMAVDVAHSADWPTVSLNLSGERQESGSSRTLSNSVGVAVSVPIFSGFAPTHRSRHAMIQQETQQIRLQNLQQQIALEVWQAWHQLRSATQAVSASQELRQQAQQSLQVAEGRYRAGAGQILELLNAQNTLASAQQQSVQATYDWRMARVTLARAVGRLERP